MSVRLKKFLVRLASDSDRMSRFVADPARELEAAGLTADEQAAVLARDGARVRRALDASPVDHMTRICRKGSHKEAMARNQKGGV